MSSKGFLYSMLSLFWKLRSKYDQIAQDEKKKSETAYFGIYSITMSIVCGGFFLLGAWGLLLLIGALGQESLTVILIVILIGIVALAELVIFAEYIFGGLMGVYYQFKCNRSPISWVALGVYIAVSIGMIAGIILIISLL